MKREESFILNRNREKDVVEAFKNYKNYLLENQAKIPANVYEIASSSWYFDPNDHRCPHDARLDSLQIIDKNKSESEQTDVEIKLLNAFQDKYLLFRYENVVAFDIRGTTIHGNLNDFRYDEFRLSENGNLIHEIEWSGPKNTGLWIIECKYITFGASEVKVG